MKNRARVSGRTVPWGAWGPGLSRNSVGGTGSLGKVAEKIKRALPYASRSLVASVDPTSLFYPLICHVDWQAIAQPSEWKAH